MTREEYLEVIKAIIKRSQTAKVYDDWLALTFLLEQALSHARIERNRLDRSAN